MAKKSKSNREKRFAVVALGMHRSGTSALAGVLTHLGCEAPKDLMDPAPMNAKGFYESESISQFDERLMASAGSAWYTWQPFNPEWFDSAKADEFRVQALAHFNDVFGGSSMPVLKDPRICLLIPFWNDVLKDAGYAPRYVLTHRHPLEVAQSLDRWAGYDPTYGQLLWMRYVLDSEYATRGKKRVFTSYSALLQDWANEANRVSEALEIAWPARSERVTAEIDAFLDTKMCHQDAGGGQRVPGLRMSPWAGEVFEILNCWVAQGEQESDWEALDRLRVQFDLATPVFSASVEAGRRDSLALQSALVEGKKTEKRLTTLQASRDQFQQAADAASAKAAELAATLEQAQTRQAEVEAALQAKDAEGTQLREIADAASAKAAELATTLEQAQTRQAEVEAALQAKDAEGTQLREIADAANAKAAELATTLEQTQTRQAEVEAALEHARSEIGDLRETLATAEGERETLRSVLSDNEDARAHLADRVATLKSELAQRRAETDDLYESLRQARDEVGSQRQELENACNQLASAERENAELARHVRTEKLAMEKKLQLDLAAALEPLRNREASARAEVKALEARVEVMLDTHRGLSNDKNDLTKALASRGDEVRKYADELSAAKSRISDLLQELHDAKSAHQALAAEQESFMRDLRVARMRDEQALREKLTQMVQANRESAREEVARAESEAAALRREYNLTQERLHAAEQHVTALLNSRSWRMMGPLRSLVTMLRTRKD